MRVLIISDYRDTQAVRPEAELMLGLKRKGISLDIITFADTAYHQRFRDAGITVHDWHPEKKYDRKFIRKLKSLTEENEYQIFFLFNSKAIINGIFAAYDLPVKVILYRGYTGHINWYDPTAYFKYLNPRVDKIVCIAQSIKDYLHSQKFFKEKKAVTINKGHHPDWYKNIRPADLTEFGVSSEAFAMACMANARPFKGIKYLLKATYQLADTPDLHLLLIGRDMDKGNLKKLLQESPMASRIHVTGWREDVLSILAACQVFVLPSIKGEATTKSLIEAMSMGTAPIMTDIPGNAGLIIDGTNGRIVPSKDPAALAQAMRALYLDRDKTAQYGAAAKKHIAANFHIDRTIREMSILFESLVEDYRKS